MLSAKKINCNIIYLTPRRKDAKEIANIMIYLGALASLRENEQFLPRSDRPFFWPEEAL